MSNLDANRSKSSNQISPTYVTIGASIKPTPSPRKEAPMKIPVIDVEKYNKYHPNTNGILTHHIAFFRSIGSVIIPENRLPKIVIIFKILPTNVNAGEKAVRIKDKLVLYHTKPRCVGT